MTRPTIDELEMLNPDELGELLLTEVWKDFPDVQHIKDLIAVGCPVTPTNKVGRVPLLAAAQKGRLELVKLLVSAGADIEASNYHGNTALHLAALGHLEVVKLLLSLGADINARDQYDRTAWDYAITVMREAVPELEPK